MEVQEFIDEFLWESMDSVVVCEGILGVIPKINLGETPGGIKKKSGRNS